MTFLSVFLTFFIHKTKSNPCERNSQGYFLLFSCKTSYLFFTRCLQSKVARQRILTAKIGLLSFLFDVLSHYVHWSLPSLSFFAKVPFRQMYTNHFSVPPLTNFQVLPYPYGRLRVRRSISFVCKLTHANWSCANHNRVPPLFYSVRFPSDCLCSNFLFSLFTPLSFHGSLSGGDYLMGRNHRFLYPPFFYFFLLPYPYGVPSPPGDKFL